jgi:hypothetical protein
MTTKKTSLFALAPLLAGALLTAAPVHAEAASVRSGADGGASAVQAHRKALSDAQTRLAKADEALADARARVKDAMGDRSASKQSLQALGRAAQAADGAMDASPAPTGFQLFRGAAQPASFRGDIDAADARAKAENDAASALTKAARALADSHPVQVVPQGAQAPQSAVSGPIQGTYATRAQNAPQSQPPAPAQPQVATLDVTSATTCSDSACAQSAVDAGGAAYIDYSGSGSGSGFSEIAGHSGGAAGLIASFAPGQTVRTTGALPGLWRITGLSDIPLNARAIPSGGFAFQTCVGNVLRLAYATRIG